MMNKQNAIDFLEKYQPLPDDRNLSKDMINEYDEIRKYFLAYPDEACIPLLLNSFGERGGLGVYQLIGDVIKKYSKDKVIPHLLLALQSDYGSIKYWNAQIAAEFPDEQLFEPLKKLLNEDDVDIRFASITAIAQLALSNIKYMEVLDLLEEMNTKETEDDICEFLEEVISDIKASKP